MTPLIKDLLKKGQWPIVDAITFADESMVILEHRRSVDYSFNAVTPLVRTKLDAFFEFNPEKLTGLGGPDSFDFNDGEFYIEGGDTSWGSEGWVALYKNKEFQWLACFGDSNPFQSAQIDRKQGKLLVLSTHNCLWSFDLEKPWEISIEDKNPPRKPKVS